MPTKLPYVRYLSELTWYLGVIHKPLVKLIHPKVTIIPKYKDVVDLWTMGHVWAASWWATFFIQLTHNLALGSFLGWLIMLLYETYIDGNKREDPRGCSIRDLGANLFGVLMVNCAYIAAKAILTLL